jgi:hypothetical protein
VDADLKIRRISLLESGIEGLDFGDSRIQWDSNEFRVQGLGSELECGDSRIQWDSNEFRVQGLGSELDFGDSRIQWDSNEQRLNNEFWISGMQGYLEIRMSLGFRVQGLG